MKLIEREIMSRVQKCNDESYNITVHDVMNAVTHLKDGKSDGYEGLSSDHFIHGNRQLYVLLSILFTLFLRHGFSPDSMILGTMIPNCYLFIQHLFSALYTTKYALMRYL